MISIAMCTYNGEKFIEEQLDSILNQTYQNIELIITDDCSNDNTIQIIKKYQLEDKRIKLFQNKQNLGFVKNFEKSISLCSGDYIALADQDDIWKINKLEVFLKEIGDNILIYSDASLVNKTSNILNKQLIRPTGNLVKGKCNKAFLFYNCVSGNTLMFKKELIKYILPIPDNFSFHDIWISFVASTIGTISYTLEPMTYYRRYENQVTASTEKNYESFFDRFRKKQVTYRFIASTRLTNFNAFYNVKFIDNDMKKLLEILIEHYENIEIGYYNIDAYQILNKYKNDIFAIKSIKKRRKYIRHLPMKLKLKKILLFSV